MSQRAPKVLLVAALVASGALLVSFAVDLVFVGDSWELLAGRPDWSASTFFEPFNEHAIVLHAFVFKVLLALFGMSSALPFFVVSITLFLLCAVLMFVFLRRRVGDWLALAGAVLLLFMGAAYEDLLWEFQMCFFGSTAAGLGAFLALDREDRQGDRLASLLLVVATAFSTLGVPFILAAAVRVGLDRDSRWRRAYVPLVPLALYAIWWLAAGHSAGSEIGLGDLPDLPGYMFDAASAGLASLLGQQPIDGSGRPPLLARALATILGVGLIYWLGRRKQLPPGLIVALVLTFSFWGLLALDRGPQRFSSRFQYPSAVFLLLVAGEVLKGQRLPRWVLTAIAVIAVAAVAGGISLLDQGYSHRQATADKIRATLAAVDAAGAEARPNYMISFVPSIFLPVRQYREAKREHGTPAYSEAELLAAGEIQRQVADRTLVAARGLRLQPANSASAGCRHPRSSAASGEQAHPPSPGTISLENRSTAEVIVRIQRFADNLSTYLGALPPGGKRTLSLPADRSRQPWSLIFEGGPVRYCAL